VFVDDSPESLDATLQLTVTDIQLLRDEFAFFHRREIESGRTIVRTLANIVFLHDSAAEADAIAMFEESYHDGRRS
jgi:hypothetical protein